MHHITFLIIAFFLAIVSCYRFAGGSSDSVPILLLTTLSLFLALEGILYMVKFNMASYHDRQDSYHREQRGKWLGN